MTPSERLRDVLTIAYQRHVLGGGSDPHLHFHRHVQEDARFLKLARRESERLARVPPTQCFVSMQQSKFLKKALERIDNPPKEEEMPSKLKALAGLAKGKIENVENEAEAALKRLHEAEERAIAGVGKINSVAGEIEQSAAELDDFANQTSNFPPDEK